MGIEEPTLESPGGKKKARFPGPDSLGLVVRGLARFGHPDFLFAMIIIAAIWESLFDPLPGESSLASAIRTLDENLPRSGTDSPTLAASRSLPMRTSASALNVWLAGARQLQTGRRSIIRNLEGLEGLPNFRLEAIPSVLVPGGLRIEESQVVAFGLPALAMRRFPSG
jgi:hypothetical protein